MAKVRIRCDECRKKISVDEAFAGGMCRCPYCKAIVKVSEKSGSASGEIAARPDAPAAKAVSEKATRVRIPDPNEIPAADPVMIQGVGAALVLACLISMCAGGGYAAWKIFHKPDDIIVPPLPPPNPFVPADKPSVAGDVEIRPPIIYLLDCGQKMQETLGYAARMVRSSVRGLPKGGKFNMLTLHDGENKWFAADIETFGPDCLDRLDKETAGLTGSGRTDLAAGIKLAIAHKPVTLVVFADKRLEEAEIKAISDIAISDKIVIVCIGVGADEDVAKSFKKLSESTNGISRFFGASELDMMGKDPRAVK